MNRIRPLPDVAHWDMTVLDQPCSTCKAPAGQPCTGTARAIRGGHLPRQTRYVNAWRKAQTAYHDHVDDLTWNTAPDDPRCQQVRDLCGQGRLVEALALAQAIHAEATR